MRCLRSSSSDGAATRRAAEIDEELRLQGTHKAKEIKLLLLGAGESGKSTLAKQMKIIHQEGFNQQELVAYTLPVFANCLTALKVVIGITLHKEEMSKKAKKVAEEIKVLHGVSSTTPQELRPQLSILMKDKAIQRTIQNLSNYRIPDSSPYFIHHLDRIFAEGFVPTVDDVLRARVKTSGVHETRFVSDDTTWVLVDVGGQRTERRKWIHCFDGVTAILFCVSLNEYDQGLEEDTRVNRMHESLQLFKDTCNSYYFSDASVILFLNKNDLFQDKIKKVDLKVCFDDYTGGKDYDKALAHIKSKFTSKEKTIYPHVSIATDTENVKFIFAAVLDTILATEAKKDYTV